jgi:superfamily II DNA/RNA helicase
MNLSKRLLKEPQEIAIAADVLKPINIEQRLYAVDNLEHKQRLLEHLLEKEVAEGQAIIFTSTKRQADTLVDRLRDGGFSAAALHGDMNQRQRTRTIHQLRRQEIRFLVATDVAARGIDVLSVTHVFNFDLPFSVEDYVHRIGRTGRAGAAGIALSFAAYKDMSLVKQIEKYTQQKMVPHVVAGLEAQLKAAPSVKKRNKGRPNSYSRNRFGNTFRSKR